MTRILIAFVLLTNIAFAQDTVNTKPRIHELGISIASFSPIFINVNYKKQIGTKTFFKLGFINLSASNRFETDDNRPFTKTNILSYSAGLSIGLEFRKEINDRFLFYHGPDLSYSYSYSMMENNESKSSPYWRKTTRKYHSGSIHYNIGFMFKVINHILVGIQTNPSIGITHGNENYKDAQLPMYVHNIKTTSYNFSFIGNDGFLYLIYRF